MVRCLIDIAALQLLMFDRIFIIEGLFSVVFSIFAFFIIPGFPKEGAFLTVEEREYLLQRLKVERGHEKITIHTIKWRKILFDWKVWLA
jgi:sugar phosphate permease